MEGAHWDTKGKKIVDSIPGKMFIQMPIIHFLPSEGNTFKGNLYNCPLYKTV